MKLSENDIDNLIALVRKAGESIMSIYNSGDYEILRKSDNSPLTEADLSSHEIITAGLQKKFPNVDVVSEEGALPAWEIRRKFKYYWLIDPLDGTKEFLNRNGEFTVNIALIACHKPVFGLVYAPVKKILYYGGHDVTAVKQIDGGPIQKLHVRPLPNENTPVQIVGSRSSRNEAFDSVVESFEKFDLVLIGSSLKLCLVAEGTADLYPRLGPTCHWDTAAAQAVVEAAGGQVVEYESGKPLQYNTQESLLNPNFLVSSKAYCVVDQFKNKYLDKENTAVQRRDVVWQEMGITKETRAHRFKQKPTIIWFTGLSGSGKSTSASSLEQYLFANGYITYLLDGDNVRHGLCSDLKFSDSDRVENIRRVGEIAKLFLDAGMIVLVSFISPFRRDRELVRGLVAPDEFIEVHVNTPMSVCEQRDIKGLYKRARAGDIRNFTGVDSPYEVPKTPELEINTAERDVGEIVQDLISGLRRYSVM